MRGGIMAVAVALLTAGMAGCGGDAENDLRSEVVDHYATGVHASYLASLESAMTMDTAIDEFLAAPSEETLAAAKEAWLAARDDYGPTEAFRFYGGPIDGDEAGVEGLVNAWPLDEAYIDYVDGDPTAGVVNDPDAYPVIDADLLMSLNEAGGEANISTGWHAIEFLLWGQDLSEDGPGARSFEDYTTAPNADRRGIYLAAASHLLLVHLEGLVAAWAPDAENYRADFVALPTEEALAMIITGIGELTLGELAGERMTVAYEERSQEDEHSCFSDNTTNDIVGNALGIHRVITGDYGSVSGPGVAELVSDDDDELGQRLRDEAAAAVESARAIPAPFDQHLRLGVADDDPGRTTILDTIVQLETLADAIGDGAAELEVAVG